MNSTRTSQFRKNPRRTLFIVTLLAIMLIDLVVGAILIPKDYNSFRCPHSVYHHDLLPNQRADAYWVQEYPMYTNSLGFRHDKVREVPLQSSKRRIMFIGDSFTEGVGLAWEDTWVGQIAAALGNTTIEVLNAGVVSYSPKFYHLKVKHLIEEVGLQFDDLYVFIDISDILNEITYKEFREGEGKGITVYRIKKFFYSRSYFYYAITNLANESKRNKISAKFPPIQGSANIDELDEQSASFVTQIPKWTLDKSTFDNYGKEGLELAGNNMRKLVGLCRENDIKVSIAVYPWPVNLRYRDIESIQVRFWQAFAVEQGIEFINLFPEFILMNDDPKVTIQKCFQPDGTHWNKEGCRVVTAYLLPYIKASDL